jgi:riboflavin synthase
MFTGIIQELGKVKNIKKSKNFTVFTIETKSILKGKKEGQSVAVNGACMTIRKIHDNKFFEFDTMQETLNKTNFSSLKKDSIVNLEPSLKFSQEIDGHIVQGHIDTTGIIENLSVKNKRTILRIQTPKNLKKYITLKGSICINGVSLTISDLDKKSFSVDLIPLTMRRTNLGILKKGDKVNLEADIMAKYLETLINNK